MPANGVLELSRLLSWKDMTADQMIGTAPKSTMMAAPGVAKAHPANCSGAAGRLRPPVACAGRRRSNARGAVMSARCQHLIDLLCRGGECGLRLALAEQDGHVHVAEDLGDLRVGGDLRPCLPDVRQIRDEGLHTGQGGVHLLAEP